MRLTQTAILLRTISLVLFGVLLILPEVCLGQVDQGSVTGVVKDQSGAVVPDARVTLIENDTNLTYVQKADSDGVYTFQPVKLGRYSLKVEAPGFQQTTQLGVEVHANQRVAVDVALTPGSVNETVQVSADAVPLLQTEQSSTGQVMTTKQINETPLSGRNYVFIAQLAAGVAPSNGSRGQGGGDFNANGQRAEQNNFILDGVDNNANVVDFLNGASYVVKPPPDALAEFTVQTSSYSAEFGHSAGAVIDAAVKSGSNHLHGDIWEYLRNDALQAYNYNYTSTPKPIDEYRQNQFGGTVGFPIVRDKLFMFGDIEATRIIAGHQAVTSVPTALMRTGDFSELLNPSLTGSAKAITLYEPGTAGTIPLTCNGRVNVFCPAQLDGVALRLLALFPAPNTNLTYNNYSTSRKYSDNALTYDIRTDWNASPRDQTFVRFSYSNEAGAKPPILGPVLDGSSFFDDGTFLNYGENFAFSESHIFTPSLTNEARFGLNYGHFDYLQPNVATNIDQTYGLGGLPFGPLNGGLPNIGITGINSIGSPLFFPANEYENVYQILDNVTRIAGSHTLKAGLNLQYVRFSTLQPTYGRGGYTYDGKYTAQPGVSFTGYGVADFLANAMDSAHTSSLNTTQNARWDRAFYVQDDWRALQRLTVNLGLRYDFVQPPIEKHDHQALFTVTSANLPSPVAGGSGLDILPESDRNLVLDPRFLAALAKDNILVQYSPDRQLVQSQKLNFAPRFGVAYSVTPRMVIRSGFGLFFGGLESTGYSGNLGQNYPFDLESNYNSAGCGVTKGVPVCPTDGITLEGGLQRWEVVATPRPRYAVQTIVPRPLTASSTICPRNTP